MYNNTYLPTYLHYLPTYLPTCESVSATKNQWTGNVALTWHVRHSLSILHTLTSIKKNKKERENQLLHPPSRAEVGFLFDPTPVLSLRIDERRIIYGATFGRERYHRARAAVIPLQSC